LSFIDYPFLYGGLFCLALFILLLYLARKK
jgi:hypothetical protein